MVVRVTLVDELVAAARGVVRAGQDQRVKLYYVRLNAEGLPVDKEARKHVTIEGNLSEAGLEGGGVVWICVGGSPTSSPQKRKPQSPFIRPEYTDATFDELPELFEDSAFKGMTEALGTRRADPRLVLMLAIPGSGKTRTVEECTKKLGYQCVRLKVLLGTNAETEPIYKCIKQAAADGKLSYAEWKSRFEVVFHKMFKEELDIKGAVGAVGPDVVRVLHVDDAQTLMGRTVVSRETWDPSTGDPFDIVMPAACSVLHQLMNKNSKLRCVMTGTNFFAPLTLSTGSEAKTLFVAIDGTFLPDWVLNCLVHKYFDIPVALHDAVREHVVFLSGNRRAVQHFLVALKSLLAAKRAGDSLTAEELREARDTAFRLWREPVMRALGKATCLPIIQSLAALIFPDAYRGVLAANCIEFPSALFPEGVKQFGLAGGLNLSVGQESIRVQVPTGCVWAFLSVQTSKALGTKSAGEIAAFAAVARTVTTGKGNLFSRLLASELSMMKNGECPLYAHFEDAWKGSGRLVPDPLVFGHTFVYEGNTRDAQWAAHRVYCGMDLAKDVGDRVVDVGFPMLRIDERGAVTTVRLMCELKAGYKPSELWKLCWTYFSKMLEFASTHKDVIVCFVSSQPFVKEQPRRKKATTTTSAADSYDCCLELMKRDPSFVIVDNVREHSLFPLADLLCENARKTTDLGVRELTEAVGGIYLGTPVKDGKGKEEAQ